MTAHVPPVEELKPCPFCAGAVQWCDTHLPDEPHTCHGIVCLSCDAYFDLMNKHEGPDTIEELKAEVARKWNRRAT